VDQLQKEVAKLKKEAKGFKDNSKKFK